MNNPAPQRNRLDAAVLLLDAGARVDDRNDMEHMTALLYATSWSQTDMCRLLLSHGASLYVRDLNGRDPEDRAKAFSHKSTRILIAAVRAAGGWRPHVAAQRKPYIDALVALRRELPMRRTAPTVPAHARLFLDTPDDVFLRVLEYWRTPYGY